MRARHKGSHSGMFCTKLCKTRSVAFLAVEVPAVLNVFLRT